MFFFGKSNYLFAAELFTLTVIKSSAAHFYGNIKKADDFLMQKFFFMFIFMQGFYKVDNSMLHAKVTDILNVFEKSDRFC